jgi:hypothetical protein
MKHISEYDNASADSVGCARFSKEMHDKMMDKRAEGRGGWHRPVSYYRQDRGDVTETYGCTKRSLQQALRNHIAKGLTGSILVDIANFCMMIWNRENPEGRGND